MRDAAEGLLMDWLKALGLSKHDLACLMIFVNLVPKYACGGIVQKQHSVVLSFLSDALKSAIKSPHTMHEIKDELPGSKVIVCLF